MLNGGKKVDFFLAGGALHLGCAGFLQGGWRMRGLAVALGGNEEGNHRMLRWERTRTIVASVLAAEEGVACCLTLASVIGAMGMPARKKGDVIRARNARVNGLSSRSPLVASELAAWTVVPPGRLCLSLYGIRSATE